MSLDLRDRVRDSRTSSAPASSRRASPESSRGRRFGATYALEYGTDSLQVHRDAFPRGGRVIVLDDVLATGGTAHAKVELVESLGGIVVGVLFVIELTFLGGRQQLDGYDVHALIEY